MVSVILVAVYIGTPSGVSVVHRSRVIGGTDLECLDGLDKVVVNSNHIAPEAVFLFYREHTGIGKPVVAVLSILIVDVENDLRSGNGIGAHDIAVSILGIAPMKLSFFDYSEHVYGTGIAHRHFNFLIGLAVVKLETDKLFVTVIAARPYPAARVLTRAVNVLPIGASANEVRTAKVAARSDFNNTTIGTNSVENVTEIEVVNVTSADGLSEAINSGETNVALSEDMTIVADNLKNASDDLTITLAANTTVTVASGAAASKDVTITGDKSSNVVLVNTNPGYEGKLSYQDSANLTFQGITFDANQISGICARGGVVTFDDCFITGELEKTIASKFVFTGCTFDVGVTQVGYGCPEVVFENCTFETDGYGIKIYKEANETSVNLTVKDCSFKNTGSEARSAIFLDHILDGFSYNITVENCTFEGYTATPTATYNKWAERMIVADSFIKTADGQYIFSYQTGAEGGSYHKILTAAQLVVTVK